MSNVTEMRVVKAARERARLSRLVYIAAPFNARAKARELKDLLEAAGHVTTSTWITSHLNDYDELSAEVLKVEALHDAKGVKRAEILVLINNEGPSTSGGMHIEFGLAIGWGKGIVIVGEPTNIFHHVDGIAFAPTIDEVTDRIFRLAPPQPQEPTNDPRRLQ